MIRKLENYPNELDIKLPILPFYSPDFHVRLGVNFEKKEFLIIDADTNEKMLTIPKDFMTFEDNSSLQSIMRRFIFVDNETIKLISQDGLEKIISIADGKFEEISFNKVPRFSDDQVDDLADGGHFYYKKAPLSPINPAITLQRLVRKFQNYKSLLLLDKLDRKIAYEHLFTISSDEPGYIDLSFNFLTWSLIE